MFAERTTDKAHCVCICALPTDIVTDRQRDERVSRERRINTTQ